jgi:hypothetical protein
MSVIKFNKFVSENGGTKLNMDEDLKFQYEDKKERVYWASVYGSNFRKVPKGFFHTTQSAYRDFCVAVAGMMPKKRTSPDFDEYLRARLDEATVMEIRPGLEEGVVVGHSVFSAITYHLGISKIPDYDDAERKHDVKKGDPAFLETRPEGPGHREIFFRLNYLMDHITRLQSIGWFERKVTREEVAEWLTDNGREPYPRDGVSPRRLRSTYPVPYNLYEQWKADDRDDDKKDE